MIKQYPVNYIVITKDYSDDHQAIDLGWSDDPNTPIYACGDGYVEDIGYTTDGGNYIKLRYNDQTSTTFMHLKDDSINAKMGDNVKQAQMVGIMGDTGYTTGVHLHLIMYDKNNNRINPIKYLYAFPNQVVNEKDVDIVMRYNEIKYIVQKGDTLWDIAKKYNISWQELYEKNKDVIGDNPNLIYPGQVLIIPNTDVITYIVQKGDTLWSIAKKYNISWQELYEKNKDVIGDNPNLIYPGQILVI